MVGFIKELQQSAYVDTQTLGRPFWLAFVLCCFTDPWIYAYTYFWIGVCKVRGHDWEVVQYAGPESGEMILSCERCGEYHSEVLY